MRFLSDLPVVGAVVGIGVCSFGCQRDLTDVDRRIERLVERGSRSIDGGAAPPPSARFIDPAATAKPDQAATDLPTTNPQPQELRFDPAMESRDVAAKLESYSARDSGTVTTINLSEALRIAQRLGREYQDAEEEYILAAIRLLIERHLWGPRFFNDTTATIAGAGDEGDFRSAVSVVNDLRVSQRLPYGGEVEAALVWSATEQLRETVGGRYRQSAELVLSGSIPLLRGAGLVAREGLIQAERTLIYQARAFERFRREFMVSIALDYFDLLEARARIQNQRTVLENLREILRGEEARFEAGRIAEFRKNIAANDVLSATATLASLQEAYILQLDRFKIRLGLNPGEAIELDAEVIALPEPAATPEEAVGFAMAYRLDLQNARDRLDDSRRTVANARNLTLPDLNMLGRVGVPTGNRAREGGLLVQPEELNYEAAVTLGLPLDREIERLGVRRATIAFQQSQREYERFRDEVAINVRQAVRNIDLARFQFDLAQRQVEINQRRMVEIRLKADIVETQTKVDAANALQQAEDARDRARTALRSAILNYLLASGQLRVARDGTFQPLPGMEDAASGGSGPAPGSPPPT